MYGQKQPKITGSSIIQKEKAVMNDSGIMEYVASHLSERRILSCSTNETSFMETPGGKVIVKRCLMKKDRLSPFWERIRFLFGLDISGGHPAMKEIISLYQENPHIPCTRLIGQAGDISVFSFMEGDSWEPDEFPQSAAIARQLGRFIGFNHIRSGDFCGVPGQPNVEDFSERLRAYVLSRLTRREAPEAVRRFLENGLADTGYALIMTDISANQFLFGGDSISACLDFDACVFGPREWELELLEACISDMDAFREGYEEYLPYPDISKTGGLYDFVMN